MAIKIFDTLSEKTGTLEGKKVNMFVCGPTVYGPIHIGNARTYVVFDAFARFLRSQKIKLFYLQNITDVDDKIIVRAAEKNTDAKTLAAKYSRTYLKDMKTLGISSVTKYAPATKYIKEIISQIKTLVKKGNVYMIDGDGYYFDVSTFPDYGKLARRTLAQAEDGVSRIDESISKRNKADFCVWKFSKPGEPQWKTELGAGRPGWHIEDTAITEHFFGPQYDIHGGGVDIKFPHHEAEIAQQESASGKKPFVRTWMHVGSLTVNGKKMSKSLGNFVTLEDFLKKHSPDALRMMVLGHHYRSPMDYTERAAADAETALDGIRTLLAKTEMALAAPSGKKTAHDFRLAEVFTKELSDDFNTPKALAALFVVVGEANKVLDSLDKKSLKALRDSVKYCLGILGIAVSLPEIPRNIRKMSARREELRGNKQFAQSDTLRKEIAALGYTIEDTPWGQLILPSRQ